MPHLTKSSFHIFMMCLTILTALVFGPLSLPAQGSLAEAGWYVSPNGNDNNSCTTPSQPCLSINQAIRLAAKGATIYVAAGTYPNPAGADVKIDKDTALSGGWNTQFTSQTGYSTIYETANPFGQPLWGLEISPGVTASVERFIIQPVPSADFSSSGIYNQGAFTLRDSIVRGHRGYQMSGGILNSGQMTITNSTIQSNSTEYSGGGIDSSPQSRLTISNSLIDQNVAGLQGGGIWVENDAVVSISHSVIRSNKCAGQYMRGGGLHNNGGVVHLENSLITGNSASGKGGGIYSANGTLEILNSTVKDNSSAELGGGMYLTFNTASITNSTISKNSDTAGASIYSDYATLDIRNSTISNNVTMGIASIENSTVSIRNSILANNGGTSTGKADCTGTIQSAGYNILGNVAGCTFIPAAGDLQNVDPKISLLVETLGYNPLAADSPAVNAGSPTGCADPSGNILSTDQRGAARVARCDIGAYEYAAPGLPARIYPLSGNHQQAATNTLFATPLIALVIDSAGSPVDHISVTFAAPDSGPSVIFSTSLTNTTTVLTDAWGTAITPKFTANRRAGPYTVSASAGEFLQSDTFSLKNIASISLPIVFNCNPNFFDDFSNPASGWPVGEDNNLMTRYLDGEYQVMSKNADYLYLIKAPTCDSQNYTVETDVHWTGGSTGSSYGIIFGMQNHFDSFYLFEVNADYQQYRLTYFTGSESYPIVPQTSSALIQGYTAPNHLKVTRNGDSIILSINQNDVWSGRNASITGMTFVGIMVSPYQDQPTAEARFDNFRLTFLYPSNKPTIADSVQKMSTDGNRIIPSGWDWSIPKDRIIR